MSVKKIVIIGGVAGGMSCAARARRLSEDAQIVVLERGPYPSFANCGLPYHIGGEIAERGKLIVQSAENLKNVHNLDVRTLNEVVRIDRERKVVVVKDLEAGREYEEPYDKLVISTGAEPIRPPLPGIDRPGIFTLRNIPDMDLIIEWMKDHPVKRVVVGGGGYIGLEVAEQLRHRGLEVHVVEAAPQVMAPLDPEMAAILHAEMKDHGVRLHLGVSLKAFENSGNGDEAAAVTVVLENGERLAADLVVMGLGVRPESGLAKDAGLELGNRGAIRVSPRMETSDPDIYAIGDTAEVTNPVTGERTIIPLAGPANRQGRMVADNIFGAEKEYPGTLGTAVLRLFGLTAACTGPNERALRASGIEYRVAHLHPANHVGYYPGGTPVSLKIIFSPETRKLLAAQAVGKDGIDKRIDVLATALRAGMTVDDIADLELCYAPPFGAAKDPVNLAAMVAQNLLDGMSEEAVWHEIPELMDTATLLDVRNQSERDAVGAFDSAVHIPIAELRARADELPRDKPIVVHCASGQRSYYATRILKQKGFDVRNLSGAWKTYRVAEEHLPASIWKQMEKAR